MARTDSSDPSAGADRHRRRRALCLTLLLAAAGLLALTGTTALYAQRELVNSDRFADRLASTLRDENVRAVLAGRVSDALEAGHPDLIALRPLIKAAAAAAAGSAPFQAAVRAAGRDLHASVFDRDRATVTLTVADIGVLVVGALRRTRPDVAGRIPSSVEARVTSLATLHQSATSLASPAKRLGPLGAAALALAALAMGAAVRLARDRTRGVAAVGLTGAVAGGVGAIALGVTRAVVLGGQAAGDNRAAAAAVWDSFLGGLGGWFLAGLACGLIVAAAAATLSGGRSMGLRRAMDLTGRTPNDPRVGYLRAAALLGAGVLILAYPAVAAQVLAALAGLALAYAGLRQLFTLAVGLRPARHGAAGARGLARRLPAPSVRLTMLCAGLAVVAVFGGRSLTTPEGPQFASETCNGHRELCGRRLDAVALASTHNSMAAASEPGWLFAQQQTGIATQLQDGIRGLLIDTHYGVRTPRGVATDLKAEGTTRAKLVAEVGEPFVAAAERLRGRIGYRGSGRPDVFLCHGACEVGATPFLNSLEAIRDFAVEHPGEVIVLSIEDKVTPTDTADAFRRSGLLPLVYQGPSGPPWPTLGDLVSSGHRIVVFGENQTGDVPWYRPQFELVQETPYGFRSVAEVEAPSSCAANRGPAAAKLFLLNNWVDTPPANRPSNAKLVNAYDALLGRARRCERRRDRLPNLVAVDFYRSGDVQRVVDDLNGFQKP